MSLVSPFYNSFLEIPFLFSSVVVPVNTISTGGEAASGVGLAAIYREKAMLIKSRIR